MGTFFMYPLKFYWYLYEIVTIECDSPTELSFAIIRGCIFRGAKREVHLNCMTSVPRPAAWLADRGQWAREQQQQLLTICKRKFNIRPPDKYILIYCCSTGTRIFRPSSLWMGRRYDIVFNENASIFTAQEWLLMSCYLRISFHYWEELNWINTLLLLLLLQRKSEIIFFQLFS